MSFIQIQGVIFFSIIFCSLIGGKKASFMARLVWIVETLIVYKMSKINYLQVIAVSLSFQIGMVLAIARDFIVKRIKSVSNKENS